MAPDKLVRGATINRMKKRRRGIAASFTSTGAFLKIGVHPCGGWAFDDWKPLPILGWVHCDHASGGGG